MKEKQICNEHKTGEMLEVVYGGEMVGVRIVEISQAMRCTNCPPSGCAVMEAALQTAEKYKKGVFGRERNMGKAPRDGSPRNGGKILNRYFCMNCHKDIRVVTQVEPE
jgi:hypothetical protein